MTITRYVRPPLMPQLVDLETLHKLCPHEPCMALRTQRENHRILAFCLSCAPSLPRRWTSIRTPAVNFGWWDRSSDDRIAASGDKTCMFARGDPAVEIHILVSRLWPSILYDSKWRRHDPGVDVDTSSVDRDLPSCFECESPPKLPLSRSSL
jgi:hypothetical protein